MLLEAWRAFEAEAESHTEAQQAAAIAAVEKRMPKRVKRKVRRLELLLCISEKCPCHPVLCCHGFLVLSLRHMDN